MNSLTAVLLLSIAVLLRLHMATWGYNFDMVSWQIVSEIALKGKVVYVETNRYNYGPIWFHILGALKQMQLFLGSNDIWNFHLYIAGFLSLVDVSIAALLWYYLFARIAILYLFNPVSIFLTGYHSQFENLAILWAFISWIILEKKPENYIVSAIFMGISLMQKHLFFFFPIWLLLGYRRLYLKNRFLYIFISYSIFLAGFVPYIFDEAVWEGIRSNVFAYASADGIAIVPFVLGKIISIETVGNYLAWIPIFSGFKFIFMAIMLGLGYWVVHRRPKDGFYLYLLVILIGSSAVVNQYLAIPLIACAVYWRYPEIWCFLGLVIIFLVFRDHNGLGANPVFQAWYTYGGFLELKRTILSVYAFQAILWVFFLRFMLFDPKD